HLEVVALDVPVTGIAGRTGQAVDRAGDLVTGEHLALTGDPIDIAVIEDATRAERRDHVVDPRAPEVQRDAQTFHVARAVHDTQAAADGLFRGQRGVGAGQERGAGLAAITQPAALAGLLEADIAILVVDIGEVGIACDSGFAAREHLWVVRRCTAYRVARIGVVVKRLAQATVQVGDRRDAEALCPGAADQQVPDRAPAE